MKNNTLLIVVGKDTSMSELGDKLETVRAVPAHAKILVIGETPVIPYYAIGVPPYGTTTIPDDWQVAVAESKAALEAKANDIEALLAQHDVSGEVCILSSDPSFVGESVARHAMLCDMAIVSDDLRKTDALFTQVVNGVLFHSPVGAMLNDAKLDAVCAPKTILVAWNSHLSAARAVHQALPQLRQATRVIIATIDPVTTEFRDGEDPGVDMAKWLSHHGCNVDVQQFPSGGQSVGESLLRRATDVGADLIVTGSYGRSRAREAIFGGTTRTMVDQTEHAVFLAH